MWFTISGNDHSCITVFIFTEAIKIMMMWPSLGSVPYKYDFLHLQNKISGPGCPCSTTILHSNAVISHNLPLSKKLQLWPFGYCITWYFNELFNIKPATSLASCVPFEVGFLTPSCYVSSKTWPQQNRGQPFLLLHELCPNSMLHTNLSRFLS